MKSRLRTGPTELSCPDHRAAEMTQRDVKNEGTSGDVYENKGEHDKTSVRIHAVFTKMHESSAD
jgi:hypothetical protein